MQPQDRRRRKLNKMSTADLSAIRWKFCNTPWDWEKRREPGINRLLKAVEIADDWNRAEFDRELGLPTEEQIKETRRRVGIAFKVAGLLAPIILTITFIRSCNGPQNSPPIGTPVGQSQQSPGGSSDTATIETVPSEQGR